MDKPQQDEKGRFLTGNSGGGRPKGARNKLGEAFLQDILSDWQANGVAAIQRVRDERPHEYLKVVASILPKEVNVTVNEYDDLTDEELAEQFAAVAAQLGSGGYADRLGISAPTEGEGRKGKPSRVH